MNDIFGQEISKGDRVAVAVPGHRGRGYGLVPGNVESLTPKMANVRLLGSNRVKRVSPSKLAIVKDKVPAGQLPFETVRIDPPKEGTALVAMMPRKDDGYVPVSVAVVRRTPTQDEWPQVGEVLMDQLSYQQMSHPSSA